MVVAVVVAEAISSGLKTRSVCLLGLVLWGLRLL